MKLWGGRFGGARDADFERFSESFSLDRRLVVYDLRVNRAYVEALGRARVLRPGEARRLARGLRALERFVRKQPDWARGETSEDVHTWVEARLARRVGKLAGKLRTGRSRNDLVATEMRMFVKDSVMALQGVLIELLEALLHQARRQLDVILPGYTHLQPAQPVLFSHYLLAYFEMFLRDWQRFEDGRTRADELPLGAGALAGTPFPIDRGRLARQLGFARVTRNSVDATCDRDFVCELLFDCTLALGHSSRLAEDLILYSSPGFGFVELDEAYSTGSSLMPQKKNPDSLELIRGKAARLLGRLTSMLALLKGLPLAYNRDLQEDKAVLFDGVDTTRDVLAMAARVVETLRIHPERAMAAIGQGFLTATDVAEELVRRGVAFAVAHEQVGKVVRYCSENEKVFSDLALSEARRFVPSWDRKLRAVAASPQLSVRRRKGIGGTAPVAVAGQVKAAERTLANLRRAQGRHRRLETVG